MLFIGRYSVLCNKFNGNAWYIIDNFVNSCYLHCFIAVSYTHLTLPTTSRV